MLRILVIEDESSLLSNILQMLHFEGFEAVGADNGFLGLQLVREQLPDLILCDIMLPEMDGLEVLQDLRRDLATALIPFIFLTARDTREDVRQGMEMGADDYISKPFSTAELLTAIRTRLERQAQAEQHRLRTLSHRLFQLQENEQQHLAHELQSEIAHLLTGLKMILNVNKRLPEDALRTRCDEAGTLVEELLNRIQNLSMELRPPLLDDLGLLPALLQHFKQYTVQTQVEVDFQHSDLDRRFPPEVEMTAFRIAQEALSNIAQHTDASHAYIQVYVDQAVLHIHIDDLGMGFDVETAAQNACGLLEMYERATLLGGKFTIASTPGVGTQVFAQLPFDTPPASYADWLDVIHSQKPLLSQESASSMRARSLSDVDTSIKIVLADAHDLTRKGLRSLLENQHDFVMVGEVTHGFNVVSVVEDTQPDVLIIDAILGWEMIIQLAQRYPQLHILMLSTQTEEAYALEALRKGIMGYALKESSVNELVQAVREVAAGRRYLSSTLSARAIDSYINSQHMADVSTNSYDPLSNREKEILQLIVQGARTSEIADTLSISPRTVETHRANLMRKLGSRTQAELVRYALQHGIVS